MKQFFPVHILIVAISLLLISALQYLVHTKLVTQGIFMNRFPSLTTIVAALFVLVVIWIVTNFSIRKYIAVRLRK